MSGSPRPPRPSPASPSLRPLPGGGGPDVVVTGDDLPADVAAVLREFAANRVALAAEVVKLRDRLQDALFEASRLAATSAVVVRPPAAPVPDPPG